MNLTLPDVPITRQMGDAQLRLELACALYAQGKVTKVPFVGVAGIFIRARARNLIPAVRPLLERLRDEAGFWLHPRFEAEVLRLAGEA